MADLNDFISENLGLAYQQLGRFGLLDNPDAESYAFEALFKAAKTYKPETGYAFSTYAVCVISNDIRRYLRSANKKRQITWLSYDAPINDEEDKTFVDILVGPDTTESYTLNKELRSYIADALRNVYDDLTNESHKKIFEIWYASEFSCKQGDIVKCTGLSQPYVSRVLSSIKYKLRLELEEYL